MPDFSKQRTKTSELVKKVGTRAVDLQAKSSQHLKTHVLKRTTRIAGLRRFIAGWLILVLFMSVATLATLVQLTRESRSNAPENGGTYTEGLIGTINNLNPLFNSGSVDESVTKLMFNSLFRYDTSGALVPDAAKEIQVDESRKVYTVTLRQDVRWHDGQPLKAEDVAFTINTIQNPATRSTLFASWQGVVVKAVDDWRITFELPAPFAPFPNALTVPIIPKHALENFKPDHLRTADFNTSPIGTGPFVFNALRNEGVKEQQIELKRNPHYFRGSPRLERFVLHTYPDDEHLSSALKQREITAAVDLKSDTVEAFAKDGSIRPTDIPLNSGVFAFFKTSQPILADANIRVALAKAIDRQAILQLFKARYTPLKTPLLPSQLGFDSSFLQQTNVAEAEQKLDAAGWLKQPNGIRVKDGQPLEFGLTTVNTAQYSALASELQKQWANIGVSIKPQLLTPEQLQQNALAAHAYDILLYGVSLGYDPDVYAYWHSSQARSGGLNFSEWKSGRADASLEVARTRLEPVLRQARYRTFLDEWLNSAPAVALYQPRVNYAYHQNAAGFVAFPSTNASERLTNVEEWTVNTRSVDRTP
ncbi:MAG: peptide ABC transporter substrate-binding protein [Candidatus Saccharimonadales bacterium]